MQGHGCGVAKSSSPFLPQGQVRWIVAQKNRVRNGELYRVVADSRGAFVQVCHTYIAHEAGACVCASVGCDGVCAHVCR